MSIGSVVRPCGRVDLPGHENVGREPTLKVGSNWMATALGDLIRLYSMTLSIEAFIPHNCR